MIQKEHNFGKRKKVRHIISATTIFFLALFCWIQIWAISSAHAEKIKAEKKTAKIGVEIINRGSTVDVAKNVTRILASQENLKVKIGQDKGPDIEQTIVFFRGEQLRTKAEEVNQILRQEAEIYAEVRVVQAADKKSADIVIMLGKNKDAPPN